MAFWIITAALALAVAGLLALAVLRGRGDDAHPAAFDLRVYRDQLKEVERDLARGVISAEDAERVRAEVSRRILQSDAQLRAATQGVTQPRGPAMAAAITVVVALVGGGLWLYRDLGAPGYGDLALRTRIDMAAELRENRPAQADAEARVPPFAPLAEPAPDYLALMEQLRKTVAERPDDPNGLTLLVRNEAMLGNFADAYRAQAQLLALKGSAATAQDYLDRADLLVMAAGGYVSPEAEAALRDALARDPSNGAALYYMGLMAAQTGRPDQAFRVWDQLLRRGPADAPWIAPIRAQVAEMAVLAGVRYTLPPEGAIAEDGRGPSAADLDAAEQMTPTERMEMIRGMVAGLSERLANDGGPAQDWARLITAYGVLGETAQARAIWTEAQQVFADRPGDMDRLRAAAEQAGIE